MVTQVGFTGRRLDAQLWCNQEIVRTVHTALRRGLLVLLNGHDDSKYVSSKILTHSTGKYMRIEYPSGKTLPHINCLYYFHYTLPYSITTRV